MVEPCQGEFWPVRCKQDCQRLSKFADCCGITPGTRLDLLFISVLYKALPEIVVWACDSWGGVGALPQGRPLSSSQGPRWFPTARKKKEQTSEEIPEVGSTLEWVSCLPEPRMADLVNCV